VVEWCVMVVGHCWGVGCGVGRGVVCCGDVGCGGITSRACRASSSGDVGGAGRGCTVVCCAGQGRGRRGMLGSKGRGWAGLRWGVLCWAGQG
jgi:hypothetical protein